MEKRDSSVSFRGVESGSCCFIQLGKDTSICQRGIDEVGVRQLRDSLPLHKRVSKTHVRTQMILGSSSHLAFEELYLLELFTVASSLCFLQCTRCRISQNVLFQLFSVVY